LGWRAISPFSKACGYGRKDTFYRDLYHFWSKIFGLLGFLLDAGARGLHRMFGRNR
jgi:hypothetical protein